VKWKWEEPRRSCHGAESQSALFAASELTAGPNVANELVGYTNPTEQNCGPKQKMQQKQLWIWVQ
jgi:hypothetical protein